MRSRAIAVHGLPEPDPEPVAPPPARRLKQRQSGRVRRGVQINHEPHAGTSHHGEWFVSRVVARGEYEYLHDDGVWRHTATQWFNGRTVYSGWFHTRAHAEAALTVAELINGR